MEPWRARLDERDSGAAWDLFIEQYRRLIFATIKHVAHDHDDVLDVFARVCETLHADDLSRLRRYTEADGTRARFSTWLVTVVRNQAIDWLRERDGRQRPNVPATLTGVQRQIFEHLVNGRSHVEAYELISARSASPMTFGLFLREVKATYQSLDASHRVPAPRQIALVALDTVTNTTDARTDSSSLSEARARIASAMTALPPDEQLAVLLFVVDEMPASEVASTVGWRNAKAVYNRVYRALATLKAGFERNGIRREDL